MKPQRVLGHHPELAAQEPAQLAFIQTRPAGQIALAEVAGVQVLAKVHARICAIHKMTWQAKFARGALYPILTMADAFGMDYRIRELRDAKGWTLEELAEKAEISFEQLSRIERGKNTNATTLLRIAGALEVPLPALFPDSLDGSPEVSEARHVLSRLNAAEKKRAIQMLRLLLPPDRAA